MAVAQPVAAKNPPRVGGPNRQRSEAIAGYLFIAIPMVLFLTLNIGSILYAVYISLWKWNVRIGPVSFMGADNYTKALNDPIFQTAIKNVLYYAVLWVPLT